MTEKKVEIITIGKSDPKKHRGWLRACVYFGKPYELVISVGDGGILCGWDSTSLKHVGAFDIGSSNVVYEAILWKDNYFLTCSSNGLIAFRLTGSEPFCEKVKDFECHKTKTLRMLKLDEDRFMVQTLRGMHFINFSKDVIEKSIILPGETNWTCNPILSKVFSGCFFLNCKHVADYKDTGCIILYDFKKGELRRWFKLDPKRTYFNCMSTFVDPKSKHEIIVGGTESNGHSYIYDTHTETILTIVSTQMYYASLPIVSNLGSYILYGESKGSLRIFGVNRNYKPSLLFFSKPHDQVMNIKLVSASRESIKVISCCIKQQILLSEIKGLRYHSNSWEVEQGIVDLKERVDYLTNDFVSDQETQQKLTFEIRFLNETILSLRILLVL